MTELAPSDVIEQALAATAGLFAKARNISLQTKIAANLAPIRADADRLTQVIVNLISNAVKFCARENGRIELAAWQEAGFLHVDVKDNGIGIAQADQQRIFERFQQAGNILTEKPQGTGLGLPISRQILQRFGGDIWVESELGEGATFSFRIPIARPVEGAAAVERAAAVGSP
jgi:signal transduction histidine kinase